MTKIINLFLLIVVFLFFFKSFDYYSSNKNIKNINLNRINIEDIVKKKSLNLLSLENDTDDVIEFNSSFSEEIKKNKDRSFWNLLKPNEKKSINN